MEKISNIPEYSISEFNKIFRDLIESNFGYIRLKGEISEIKTATKGQIYLTLKDDISIISGVIWENKINNLEFYPEMGSEVIVTGKITTWSRFKTTYQIDIDNVEVAGEGALLKLIEERKKRLLKKGYFDKKYKKPLPYIPKKIGVITSPTGSVIYDIINRIKNRFPTPIDLWPVSVQGKNSALEIINAIKGFNNTNYENKPEVIIIARGGGSVEDLISFNDENLAIEVFKSRIPIVSAIGHDTDTTIIDFVSDFKAATPTAAAEKIVPVREELVNNLNNINQRLSFNINKLFKNKFDNFFNLSKFIKSPNTIIISQIENFKKNIKDLKKSFISLFLIKNNSFKLLSKSLHAPENLLKQKNIEFKNVLKFLNKNIYHKIESTNVLIKNADRLLESNSIDKNLRKGFVLIKKAEKIIKESKQISDNDKIKIIFSDKNINVKLKKIN